MTQPDKDEFEVLMGPHTENCIIGLEFIREVRARDIYLWISQTG